MLFPPEPWSCARPRRARLALLLGALFFAGCAADFDPYTRLNSLRVLAVAANPSNPATGETTTLAAYVYVPDVGAGDGVPGVSYEWSWCPFPGTISEGAPCRLSAEDQAALAQAGITLPPLALGNGAHAELPNSVPAAALAQICANIPGDVCEGGWPVQVKLRVKTATDEVTSVATVRFRFAPDATPNTPPVVEDLRAELGGVDFPVGPDPVAIVPRDEESIIKAIVSPAAVESYIGLDNDMQRGPVKERLTFTWFAETGAFEFERTGFVEGTTSLEKNLRNKWTPERRKDYAKDRARVVVVARDNRGGVTWRDGFVALQPTP